MRPDAIRFDSRKRIKTVTGLPVDLIKKFIIVENRDSRGRAKFHVIFKKHKFTRPDYKLIPKNLRVHNHLIEAEIAIFQIVEIHLWKENSSNILFINEQTYIKKLLYFIKKIIYIDK